jgi:hypothetical protein
MAWEEELPLIISQVSQSKGFWEPFWEVSIGSQRENPDITCRVRGGRGEGL